MSEKNAHWDKLETDRPNQQPIGHLSQFQEEHWRIIETPEVVVVWHGWYEKDKVVDEDIGGHGAVRAFFQIELKNFVEVGQLGLQIIEYEQLYKSNHCNRNSEL